MPTTSSCFSNPPDVPPGIGNRDAVQPAPPGPRRMHTGSTCFRYPGDVPSGPRQMHTGTSCFRYPGDVPPRPRQMTTSSTCFRY
jgi:hypothetical protein